MITIDVLDLVRSWERDASPMPMVDILRMAASEIARLREERRWISVCEKLPDDEKWLDVACPWGETIGYYDGKQWRDEESETLDEVTHFRKRTPGPEGDGNG
jgi:hypothetical protein